MNGARRNHAIKICGMCDPENIRQIATLAPDYMGLICARVSKRFIGDRGAEARAAVPPGIKAVGVFVNEGLDSLLRLADELRLDAVQLHGDESASFITGIKSSRPGLSVWKAISVHREKVLPKLEQYAGVVDMFVFDNGSGGTGETFEWSRLIEYCSTVPFLVAGGIGPAEARLLERSGMTSCPAFHGIDINSRVESSIGMKDFDLVKQIIREVRV